MQLLIRGLIVTLTGLAATAAAADRPVVGPVPDWVQPAAAEIAPGASTDAAVLVLLNDQQVRLSTTAMEIYNDSRLRIQTPQGLQSVGTIALTWQPDADIITVHRLSVRRGTEVRDLLGNGDGFTILRREDRLEQATLTGTLTAILQPSDLQVGDIVEFAYTRRHADPVVPDKPDLQFAWFNSPVRSARFRATWPAQMAVRWQLRDFKPALQESSTGGNRSIAFELENPPPLLQPTYAPARFAALRRAQLTAFQSWPEVSRRFAPLYAEASKLAAESPLRAEVERIRKAATDPKERAAAALRLAQEQVRYVLLAMNQGALVPASADQTWQRRYGDCKAKTALLLALLRELGIEAEPVTVSSSGGDGIDQLLPAIGAFDHVLVRARLGGKTYWLDGTRPADRRLDLLEVPFYSWGLPLTARGSELVRIQPTPLEEPELLREVNLDASKGVDAPAQFQARAVFRGDSALGIKLTLDNADATQRDQGMRNYWRNNFDGLQVGSVASRYDETNGTLTWTAEGSLKLEWDDEYYEPENMNPGFKADFSRPAGTDAEAPYAVSFPEYSVNRISVKLPTGTQLFTVSGEDIDRKLAGVEYKRKASIVNSVFTAESSQRSLVPEIAAQDARAAEPGLREMYKNRLFIMRPRQVPSAAELQSQAGKPLDSAGAYIDRGYDMTVRRMYEPAIAEFTSALKLEPDNVLALANRGLTYLDLGRADAARTDLRRALALDPKDAMALRGLGTLARDEGRMQEAIDLLSRSLLVEDSSWTRERRIDAYLKVGDVAHAGQDLVTLSLADPARTSHFESRAINLMNEGRVEDVVLLAKAALDGHAGPAAGVVIAAKLHAMTGRLEQARNMLNEAIARAPDADLYAERAFVGTDPNAIADDFELALKLNPTHVRALQSYSSLRLARKQYREALQLLDRLEAAAPLSSLSHRQRAEGLARLGDFDAARKSYAAARQLSRSPAMLNDLCWSEAITSTSLLEDALRDCDAALAAAPDSPPMLDSRALVLLKLKRYAEAIAVYDAVIQKMPREAGSYYGRGIAKLRLGKAAEAESDLATARGITPYIEYQFVDYGIQR